MVSTGADANHHPATRAAGEYNLSEVKKSLNVYLSYGQVRLKLYLTCCQIMLGIQGNITLHCNFFYLPVGHWMLIFILVLIEILLNPAAVLKY